MFKPTPEQQAIVEAARGTTDNLIVRALAGAAKTSTLELIAKALPDQSILNLAFNKRIVQELDKRMPKHCTNKTLNGLGHQAWGKTLGKRLTLDTSKNYRLLKSEIDSLKGEEKDRQYEFMSETLDMIGTAKSLGYIPSGHFEQAKGLLGDDELWEALDPEPTIMQQRLIKNVMIRSIKAAMAGEIDFDDQILMPTCFSAFFDYFPLVLVDETQDLSELNHAMLKKVAKKRLIAVGDENQSIYAFRGAHQHSMGLMEQGFSMAGLRLSTTFRCPRAVVREARWKTPHMQFPDWASEGSVSSWQGWGLDQLLNSATIICRNNAPLFGMAIKLLRSGRNCKIVGNEIGKGLLRIMKKLGSETMSQTQALDALERWFEEQRARSRSLKALTDKKLCMELFLRHGDTLFAAMQYAETLFKQEGPVTLLTGHKAKGLEFEDVFFLDPWLIDWDGEDAPEQEKNLRYVIQTRSKRSLTYLNSEDLEIEA